MSEFNKIKLFNNKKIYYKQSNNNYNNQNNYSSNKFNKFNKSKKKLT